MLPSSIYGETAYKYAKLLVEGAKGRKLEVRKIWIASRGGVTWRGNLNIRLVSTSKVLVRYFNGKWIELEARFGKKYLPLIEELIRVSVVIQLYLILYDLHPCGHAQGSLHH